MPKFIVYSDLHLHNWEYGSKPTTSGYNSRLLQQKTFLFQLGQYCKDNNIKDVFFCGDFFHTHGKLSTDVIYQGFSGIQYLNSKQINQYMLVGNHDISKNFQNKFPLIPNSLEIFSPMASIVSAPVVHKFISSLNIKVSMIPFTEDKGILHDTLKDIAEGEDLGRFKNHFLFMHQGVSGVPMGSGYLIDEILTPDMIPSNITRAFVGHYHVHKTIDRLTVVGPPMQHNWGDVNELGGVLEVDSETGEFKKVIIGNPSKFVEINEGFIRLTHKIGNIKDLQELVANNFIRVTSASHDMESLNKLKKLLIEDFRANFVEFRFSEKEDISLCHVNPSSANSLDFMINEYNKHLDERTIQVGEEIRKGSYAVP